MVTVAKVGNDTYEVFIGKVYIGRDWGSVWADNRRELPADTHWAIMRLIERLWPLKVGAKGTVGTGTEDQRPIIDNSVRSSSNV